MFGCVIVGDFYLVVLEFEGLDGIVIGWVNCEGEFCVWFVVY